MTEQKSIEIEEGATYLLPNGEKVNAVFVKIPQEELDAFAADNLAGDPCKVCGESFEERDGFWKLYRQMSPEYPHEVKITSTPGGETYIGDTTAIYYIVDRQRLHLVPEGAPDHKCDFCGTSKYLPSKTDTVYTVDDLQFVSHGTEGP